MADLTMTYNAEQVACDFYDWLVEMGYCDIEDELEDLNDVVKDFYCIQEKHLSYLIFLGAYHNKVNKVTILFGK